MIKVTQNEDLATVEMNGSIVTLIAEALTMTLSVIQAIMDGESDAMKRTLIEVFRDNFEGVIKELEEGEFKGTEDPKQESRNQMQELLKTLARMTQQEESK